MTTPRVETGLTVDADGISSLVLEVCKSRGWSLHWTHRGAYLHLEASELIEAVRGKRGSVLGEAADVLFVLMSITANAGIRFSDVIQQLQTTAATLMTKPHYAGE
jgi:NTP pyrophosphatase (non-canonical NTP hydrolase)